MEVFTVGEQGLLSLFYLLRAMGMTVLAGMLCALPFGGGPAVDLLGRCAAAALLLALNWRLRPLYLDMQAASRRGWFLFSLIPLAYYISLYFYIMRVPPERRVENLAAVLITSSMVVRSEEKIRVYRHDMRFTLHTLAAMLERGDTEGALRYLGKSNAKLEDTALTHYCESPVIDAVLGYYAEQAQKEGIQVQIRMTLGRDLPVDETELCAVFANALENAIHACEKLPMGALRRIEVTAVAAPHFCVEIANTCAGNVEFDSGGFPVSREPGHGTGTRSIAAFFAKYKAVYQYSVTEDGMFRLRFLVNRPHAQTGTTGAE